MIIRIVWPSPESDVLLSRAQVALEELGLLSHTTVELFDTPEFREELKIKDFPALCILEPSIQFQDTICEWVVPEHSELVNLFISLFGADEEKKNSCGTCSTGSCDTCAC